MLTVVDPVINVSHKSTPEPVQYPCNFCGKSFTELRKWREHEEGLHLPKQAYVCFYCSADATCVKVGKDSCYAIEAADTFQGVRVHSIMAQAIGSAPGKNFAKTLTRRKNFEKHLADVHKVQKPSPEATPLAGRVRILACGFCDEVFQDIDLRMKHVGKHYRSAPWLSNQPIWDNSRMLENLRKADHNIDQAWQELRVDIAANHQLLRSHLDAVAHTLHRRFAIGFETGRILALDAEETALLHIPAQNAAVAVNSDERVMRSESSRHEQMIIDEQPGEDLQRPPKVRETRGSSELLGDPLPWINQPLGAPSAPDSAWDDFEIETSDWFG